MFKELKNGIEILVGQAVFKLQLKTVKMFIQTVKMFNGTGGLEQRLFPCLSPMRPGFDSQ